VLADGECASLRPMGERTGYTPGTFCWVELTTTDQAAAKQFYGELFGWEAEDMPVGPGMVYSMMRLDGKVVGAITGQPQQQRDAARRRSGTPTSRSRTRTRRSSGPGSSAGRRTRRRST